MNKTFAHTLVLALVLTGCAKKEQLAEQPASPSPLPVAVEEQEQDQAGARAQDQLEALRSEAVPAAKMKAEAKALMRAQAMGAVAPAPSMMQDMYQQPPESREKYQTFTDNPVKLTTADAISTLSLDVDTGSYSNTRRFLSQGQLPPKDAVRVEELLNYFSYDYPAPNSQHPFAVSTEIAAAPWNPEHLLLRVGVKAVEKNAQAMPPANLVFLVDVSGSMDDPKKLPLVQATLKMLVDQLRPQDKVSLVVYAGRTAVELEPTSGEQKAKIRAAIARLQAGGSTAGEAAIKLAYEQARAGYIKGGINRILLATDGDFNVGVTDIEQLKDMIERNRESGVSLTTLGFGEGNYQETVMEQLADVGNGNYSYIDSVAEGRKVLVEELSSTFNTVAADVKLQLEFNSAQVAEWRLIGYENRVLREQDFKNDKIDAAEVGAGKSVTAIYELTPVGKATLHSERRYGAAKPAAAAVAISKEMAFLKVRYKQPGESRSTEFSQPINMAIGASAAPSADWRFAAAVAGFGQLLRGGEFTGNWSYRDAKALATQGLGRDTGGYRQEFVKLVELAGAIAPQVPEQRPEPVLGER